MKRNRSISKEKIQEALKKFKEQGGLIKKLPDEVTPRSCLVGARYAMYENLSGNPLNTDSSLFF